MKLTVDNPGEAWLLRLLAVLDEIAVAAGNHDASPGDRIHELRKAAKQGRALLKLAPGNLREKARRHRTTLRDMRRQFGPARDARVDLQLFEDFCGSRSSESLGQARDSLAAKCSDQESKAPAMRGAIRGAARIAKDVRGWETGASANDEIIERCVASYKKARSLLPSDESPLKDLHEFRSAVVDHRYQMRLFCELQSKAALQRERHAQELRESLGEYLDIERLIDVLLRLDVPEDEVKRLRKGQQKRLKQSLADAELLFDPKPRIVRKELEGAWRDCV